MHRLIWIRTFSSDDLVKPSYSGPQRSDLPYVRDSVIRLINLNDTLQRTVTLTSKFSGSFHSDTC